MSETGLRMTMPFLLMPRVMPAALTGGLVLPAFPAGCAAVARILEAAVGRLKLKCLPPPVDGGIIASGVTSCGAATIVLASSFAGNISSLCYGGSSNYGIALSLSLSRCGGWNWSLGEG